MGAAGPEGPQRARAGCAGASGASATWHPPRAQARHQWGPSWRGKLMRHGPFRRPPRPPHRALLIPRGKGPLRSGEAWRHRRGGRRGRAGPRPGVLAGALGGRGAAVLLPPETPPRALAPAAPGPPRTEQAPSATRAARGPEGRASLSPSGSKSRRSAGGADRERRRRCPRGRKREVGPLEAPRKAGGPGEVDPHEKMAEAS